MGFSVPTFSFLVPACWQKPLLVHETLFTMHQLESFSSRFLDLSFLLFVCTSCADVIYCTINFNSSWSCTWKFCFHVNLTRWTHSHSLRSFLSSLLPSKWNLHFSGRNRHCLPFRTRIHYAIVLQWAERLTVPWTQPQQAKDSVKVDIQPLSVAAAAIFFTLSAHTAG